MRFERLWAAQAIVRTFAFNLSEVGNWGVLSRGKIRFALHFKRIILDVLLRIDCRGQSARSGVRRSLQVMYAFLMEPRGLGNRVWQQGWTQPLPLVLLGKCMILVLATHSSGICERISPGSQRGTLVLGESSKRSSHSSLLVPRDQQEGKMSPSWQGKLI